ncbi:cysteine proteinase [Myriangium duriaei CBS 260.36]|uniref:Cysteine proteinase n=1 Tax=Myriangium duriaei CBS 260.36 TaxID=1168546 RepID=A0A9P4ME96_9PEZI|nr:cysteine proteinase [Myriangium duriaei CBS 260.36]
MARSDGSSSTSSSEDENNSSTRKAPKRASQESVDAFWNAYTTKYPGLVSRILPEDVFAKSKTQRKPGRTTAHGQGALKSYEEAKKECTSAVRQISKECRRVNMRYRDLHFDLDLDLKFGTRRCLDGIEGNDDYMSPENVKRIPEIFKKPQFFVDGAAAADVRQGRVGDCWFLAAVGALGDKQGLIDKICVDRDEYVGVYGFVFNRDGEWIHTVVDDKLYLTVADYNEMSYEQALLQRVDNRKDSEQEYKEVFQTGSRALYFAQCSDENETWLPLLEKAYAKVHGDYSSISGGFTGEAIEDLTGGVSTELFASDILDKDKFWDEEMKYVGQQFLFGCSAGIFDGPDRDGIVKMHAYTVLRATEYEGEKLLLVRNPWGMSEWTGRWSDGSEQWTPASMQALQHKFGNDGIFWISYEDLLRKYQWFDRTRLFDDSWKVCQQWSSIDVGWTADYNQTKFTIKLSERSPVVVVLSQLDDRYWKGFEGQYTFALHFRLDKDDEDGYVVRSHGNYLMNRSVSTEVELEPGSYSVYLKVTAKKNPNKATVEEVIRKSCGSKQEKLVQVGLSYDLAHVKGIVVETEGSKKQKAEEDAKAEAKNKKKATQDARDLKYKTWLAEKRKIERARREKTRLVDHKRRKAEQKAESKSEVTSTDDDGKHLLQPGQVPSQAAQKSATEGSDEKQRLTVSDSDEKPQPIVCEVTSSSTSTADLTPEEKEAEAEPATVEEGTKETDDAKPQPDASAGDAAGESATVPTESSEKQIAVNQKKDNDDDDAETVVSFASSIDSILDLEDDAGSKEKKEKPDDDEDSDNEEIAKDPWNAICVVGLRVFNKSGDVVVDVVRPKTSEDDEDTPLDVDDPAKGVLEDNASTSKPTGD